jgi:hypothetical protein
MRGFVIAVCVSCGAATMAVAQVSVGIGISAPGVSIGINVPAYPSLIRVPGYPVYYAPGLQSNFFFYDGMYWVYQGDNWYASTWYNGPWGLVDPGYVPVYLLQVPVRYYRAPPPYFRGWRAEAAPHWGEHWGPEWEQRRRGWDQRDRRATSAPAPRPVYQQRYPGERYPQQVGQQQELHRQNYRYQPREPVVRQQYEAQTQAHGQPPGHDKPGPDRRQRPGGKDKQREGGDERAADRHK